MSTSFLRLNKILGLGYDLAAISDMPRNWKQAIARLV